MLNMILKTVPGKDQAGDQTCIQKALSVVINSSKTVFQAQNYYVYKFLKCRETNPLLGSHSKDGLESMNL